MLSFKLITNVVAVLPVTYMYLDAVKLMSAVRMSRLSDRDIAGLEDLLSGSWRLLLGTAVDDPSELHALVDATVGRALAPGRGSPADLIDTLRAYLAHGANLNTTARAVYAHRHTVAHRLTRVRELTGHDAQTPDGQAQLTLGLQALAVRRAAAELSHPRARVA